MLYAHFKIALLFVLGITALYQWLRADSAIGYVDGLISRLKTANKEIQQLKQRVATLQKQIEELRGLA